jgi:hypothetical protein
LQEYNIPVTSVVFHMVFGNLVYASFRGGSWLLYSEYVYKFLMYLMLLVNFESDLGQNIDNSSLFLIYRDCFCTTLCFDLCHFMTKDSICFFN